MRPMGDPHGADTPSLSEGHLAHRAVGYASMSFFIAMVTATFAGMCVYALTRARRALAESVRVRGLLDEARVSRIRDAAPGTRVVVTGRVSGAGGATVTAPFTGRSAVWACAKAQ